MSGDAFVPALDERRLGDALREVWNCVRDGEWWTLHQIQLSTRQRGYNLMTQTIASRLRDMRLPRFGGYVVERRRTATPGVHEYRVHLESKGSAERKLTVKQQLKKVEQELEQAHYLIGQLRTANARLRRKTRGKKRTPVKRTPVQQHMMTATQELPLPEG